MKKRHDVMAHFCSPRMFVFNIKKIHTVSIFKIKKMSYNNSCCKHDLQFPISNQKANSSYCGNHGLIALTSYYGGLHS